MGKGIERLSALTVSRKLKRGYYNDGGGLYLQVGKHGAKSWVFRFRIRKPAADAGRLREMGLGSYQALSLADAREAAHMCRKQLAEGRDPIEVRVASRAEVAANEKSFDYCAAQYIESHESGWRNEKHVAQWKATLATYVSPHLGKKRVSEIDPATVMKVLGPIWVTKRETAKRVRGRIEAVLAWAAVMGYRQRENPARWKGCIDHLVPSHNKLGPKRHHPALPFTEMPDFMATLRCQDGVAAAALEFAILTAARTSEVIGAQWSEIDLARRLWIVPAERMKAGNEHRVPIAAAAIKVLRDMQHLREGNSVFPNTRTKGPLSNMALLSVLKRMGRSDLTTHGFRSTFRDWAAEVTDAPREVAEMALAHAVGNAVEAAYRRGDLLEKRRKLLADWAEYCGQIGQVNRISTATVGAS